MKKIGIILAILVIAILASSFTFSPGSEQAVDVREVKLGSHKYVVATSWRTGGTNYPGGISIIHSPGCDCGKK